MAVTRQSAVRFILALGAAYGIFNTAYRILWFAGSSAVGILYGRSLASAVAFAVVTQLAAIPLLLMVRRRPA